MNTLKRKSVILKVVLLLVIALMAIIFIVINQAPNGVPSAPGPFNDHLKSQDKSTLA